jgi:hypothetical protein
MPRVAASAKPAPDPAFGMVREKRMAEQLEIATRTLRAWRVKYAIPHTRVGKLIFYRPELVIQALMAKPPDRRRRRKA